jgi:ectoine hydroxylase-related dioxygenase (phytanoyl-CoA dioxygenase family)
MTSSQQSSYGVCRVTSGDSDLDLMAEEILRCGYVVVDSGLSPADIAEYRERLDAVYSVQQEEIGGEENLQRINDANIVRCLLAYDDKFLAMATMRPLMQLAERLLGENFVLLMQNGVINRPSKQHFQINWHRDLNYQHWVNSRTLALSALLCLDPFSAETGGTHVLAGTHLREEFPSVPFIRRHEQVVEAAPGSLIIFDSMLFHRAGKNTSGIIRRAVNHVVAVPILAQQISIPDMLKGRYADDPFLSKYLGYRWNPRAGVLQWRLQKLDDANKMPQKLSA